MTARRIFRWDPGASTVIAFVLVAAVAAHAGPSPWLRSMLFGAGAAVFLGPVYLRNAWRTVDGRPTIAVDFDGVLHSYRSGWKGTEVIPDPPVEGAIDWLWQAAQSYRVVVVSSRARSWRGRRAIRDWLRSHSGNLWTPTPEGTTGLVDVEVTAVKVPAVAYLDDRALRFEGPPFPDVDEMLALRPWNAPDASPQRTNHAQLLGATRAFLAELHPTDPTLQTASETYLRELVGMAVEPKRDPDVRQEP
tara:strand:+ start:336 stop:1079 length:744 start_codon:yes stop_codon:yes gene_type:complete